MKHNYKKLLSFVLMLSLLMAMISQSVFVSYAEETDTVATLKYSVSNGIATIIGVAEKGNIVEIPAEYDGVPVAQKSDACFQNVNVKEYRVDEGNRYFSNDENGVLYNYDKTTLLNFPTVSELTTFKTPESVNKIGKYAFHNAKNLIEVTLSVGVKSIESNAFWSCDNLTDIYLPEGLQSISFSAFWLCYKLNSISLPESIQTIDSSVFEQCRGIKSFYVHPENNVFSSDENGVLYNKDKTALLNYPAGSLATSFIVPESVTTIKTAAFANSANLESIILNDSIVDYGVRTFQNSGIESIVLPDGLTEISEQMFDDCSNLSNITIPDSITVVGNSAFRSCTSLKTVDLPDGVTKIGEGSFRFSSIETISLPKNLEVIEKQLFHYCRELKSVEIPVSVIIIEGAFTYGNDDLTDIYYHGTEEQWNSIEIDETNVCLDSAIIHYNFGKESGSCGENATYSYDADSKILTISGEGDMFSFDNAAEYGWSCYKDDVEFISINSKVTSVGANAFANFSVLKEVVMSNTVTYLGENAFANCPVLSLVSSTAGKFEVVGNPFNGCNDRLTMFSYATNHGFNNFAQNYGYKLVPISFDSEKNVLKFNSDVTVYNDLDYHLLKKFLNTYNQSEYIYFSKLVFHGVEPEFVDIEDLENEVSAQHLTFNNLYVSLKAVKGEEYEDVTFSQFIDLMENGDYDAFMFELKSDEGSQTITLKERWNQIVEGFIADVLRVTSKIINFFRKLFK